MVIDKVSGAEHPPAAVGAVGVLVEGSDGDVVGGWVHRWMGGWVDGNYGLEMERSGV